MRIPLAIHCALLALFLASCAPLTYSETGAVDFARYRVVRVSVSSTSFTGGGSAYLAAKLDEVSGFERATIDPLEPVDAVLNVNVEVNYSETEDPDGNVDPSYDVTSKYSLVAGGSSIDSGTTSSSSSDPDGAVDEALAEVAGDYIAPYRL